MEPMNFTAKYEEDKCLLIGPNQRPQLIQELVSQIYKIPMENVRVESTLSGGGFGRRLAVDYALEALIVSKESGYPVKVFWTREDDVLHDYFRTINFHHLKVGLRNKSINSWFHHIVTKSIGDGAVYEVQGAADLPYKIPNISIGYSRLKSGIKIGSWRSVAHSFNSFVVNNTIAEIAESLNSVLLQFYLELLGGTRTTAVKMLFSGYRGEVVSDLYRLKAVLQKAAELAQWEKVRDENTKLGIACAFYKTSYAAHVVEAKKEGSDIKIFKVTSVLDCGKVVHPMGVKAQMEGAISDAITISLKSSISIKDGIPQELNFDSHPVTRIKDMPELNLFIMASNHPPSGACEPPFPSVATAIANALHSLTKKQISKLPIILP